MTTQEIIEALNGMSKQEIIEALNGMSKQEFDDFVSKVGGGHKDAEARLIELHSATCAEITRYRDREWHNQGIFTVALIGILGFILLNKTEAKNAACIFDVALVLLAVGNIWFTMYAHHCLTKQRNILAYLRLLLQFHKISAEGNPILPPGWKRSPSSFNDGWLRGIFSHLIWFFVVDAWLVYEGIRLLHSG